MHLVLRHLTPVFCEITFDGVELANIVLGFHGGGDHFLKVRGILGYCRGEGGVIKGSMAETVGQQTSHWMGVAAENIRTQCSKARLKRRV